MTLAMLEITKKVGVSTFTDFAKKCLLMMNGTISPLFLSPHTVQCIYYATLSLHIAATGLGWALGYGEYTPGFVILQYIGQIIHLLHQSKALRFAQNEGRPWAGFI